MNLAEKIKKLEQNIEAEDVPQRSDRDFLTSHIDLQIYRTHESDTDVYHISDDFSYFIWRVTPDGRVGSVLDGLDGTYKLDISANDRFNNRHRHSYIELAYICKGELSMEISGQNYIFQQGEAYIIDRNCVHSEDLYKADNAVVFLSMSETFFDEIFLKEVEDEPFKNL